MLKHISIVTYSEEDAVLFANQLNELFFGLVLAESISTRNHSISQLPPADLYLIGNTALAAPKAFLPAGAESVYIRTTFTKRAIKKIKRVPAGSKALFVSCNEALCNEAINRLKALGIDNIELSPYYPGAVCTEPLQYAITPGESRYMPEVIHHMIDVGSRYLSAETIMEVAIRLNLDQQVGQAKLNAYFNQLADDTYNYNMLVERSARSESRFDILLDILSDGVIGVDENGIIFAYNKAAESVIEIAKSQVIGHSINSVLPMLPPYSVSDSISSEPFVVRIKGNSVRCIIKPIISEGRNIGMFISVQHYKTADTRQTKNMQPQEEYRARYTFNDIIRKSPAVCQACDIALKMASRNSSVLITGESGTGKELLAHAIHNASLRKNDPFVAINCAALPDSLLESELFGYEEGAFTGARKGGKPGLFEYANHGSIFLDEVEGMSPALQIKLLRVLQEKEIMHVGGNSIIHVDVRVIATSNEPLEDLVSRGQFRADLYYRLSTLPVLLPPLRERKEDLPDFIEHFKAEFGATFNMEPAVHTVFSTYSWPGNVRELRNCIEYFSYLEKDMISLRDLPPNLAKFISNDSLKLRSSIIPIQLSQVELFVLQTLYKYKDSTVGLGRASILEIAQRKGTPITQAEVRAALTTLQGQGYIIISLGRRGSSITEEGIKLLNSIPSPAP